MPFYRSSDSGGQGRDRAEDSRRAASGPWSRPQDHGERPTGQAAGSRGTGEEPGEERDNIDLIDQEPVPLDEAAARLEMSPEALLTAFRAGDYRGFVDEGTLFIYVPEAPAAAPEAPAQPAPSADDTTVVEFQRIEIDRLLKANRELQEEKDRLYRLLEREQVLRQGIQRTLDRAWTTLLPAPKAAAEEGKGIETIDRYGQTPETEPRKKGSEDAPLDIGNFLGRHD